MGSRGVEGGLPCIYRAGCLRGRRFQMGGQRNVLVLIRSALEQHRTMILQLPGSHAVLC